MCSRGVELIFHFVNRRKLHECIDMIIVLSRGETPPLSTLQYRRTADRQVGEAVSGRITKQ